MDALSPLVVGDTDDDLVDDVRVFAQRILHLRGEDVGAATDDEIRAAVGDVQISVAVEPPDVSDRVEPVGGWLRRRHTDVLEEPARPEWSHVDLADFAGR